MIQPTQEIGLSFVWGLLFGHFAVLSLNAVVSCQRPYVLDPRLRCTLSPALVKNKRKASFLCPIAVYTSVVFRKNLASTLLSISLLCPSSVPLFSFASVTPECWPWHIFHTKVKHSTPCWHYYVFADIRSYLTCCSAVYFFVRYGFVLLSELVLLWQSWLIIKMQNPKNKTKKVVLSALVGISATVLPPAITEWYPSVAKVTSDTQLSVTIFVTLGFAVHYLLRPGGKSLSTARGILSFDFQEL